MTVALERPAELAAAVDAPSSDPGLSDFGPPPIAAEQILVAKAESTFGPPPADLLSASREHARALVAQRKRDRLAALTAEAAALVSDDELDGLISRLEATVAEKRAEAELRQARESLERLVAAFPQTGAADRARRMLDRGPAAEAPAKVIPVEAPR